MNVDITTIRNVITFERASELYEKFKDKYYFIDFLNKELIRSKVGFIITDGIIRCHKDLNLNKISELGDVSYYVDEGFFGFEFFDSFRVAITDLKYEAY